MSYEIKYKSKWTGKETTHKYSGNEAGARAWTESLAKDNHSKAVAEHVETNLRSNEYGKRTHLVSEGHDE